MYTILKDKLMYKLILIIVKIYFLIAKSSFFLYFLFRSMIFEKKSIKNSKLLLIFEAE